MKIAKGVNFKSGASVLMIRCCFLQTTPDSSNRQTVTVSVTAKSLTEWLRVG